MAHVLIDADVLATLCEHACAHADLLDELTLEAEGDDTPDACNEYRERASAARAAIADADAASMHSVEI